jgi:hypothetical protein
MIVLSSDPSSGGATLLAAARHAGSYDHINFPFTSSREPVSPACSASSTTRRCQKLLIMSLNPSETYVILVPLRSAVGLMELRYDGKKLSRIRDTILSITDEFTLDCVPLDIISYDGRLIVICLEGLRTLRSCDIRLNHTDVSQSIFRHCMCLFNFPEPIVEDDYQYISNFVPYPTQGQVVFILRGVIYGIRYDRFSVHTFSSLGDITCNHLEYAGDDRFYTYCADGQAKIFDTNSLSVTNASSLTPYTCPGVDGTLFKVQQTNQDTIIQYSDMNYRTPGVNFTTGICYNTDTFIFMDSVEGTKAFRPSTGLVYPISSSSRDRKMVIFRGPYAVVYRDSPPEVLLYNSSFSLIVNFSVGTAVSVGIITDLTIEPALSPAPPTVPPTTPTNAVTSPQNGSPKADVWYKGPGITLWIVLFLIALAVIIIPIAILAYR